MCTQLESRRPGRRETREQMRLVGEEHDQDEDVTVGRRGDGQVKGKKAKLSQRTGVGARRCSMILHSCPKWGEVLSLVWK